MVYLLLLNWKHIGRICKVFPWNSGSGDPLSCEICSKFFTNNPIAFDSLDKHRKARIFITQIAPTAFWVYRHNVALSGSSSAASLVQRKKKKKKWKQQQGSQTKLFRFWISRMLKLQSGPRPSNITRTSDGMGWNGMEWDRIDSSHSRSFWFQSRSQYPKFRFPDSAALNWHYFVLFINTFLFLQSKFRLSARHRIELNRTCRSFK